MDIAIDALKFNDSGLIPVIAQDYKTKDVLMHAYMNRESLIKTLTDGKMCYYSRSRGELWVKGATSGHTQWVRGAMIDCDADTLLFFVEQTGAACHTGEFSCFHTPLLPDGDKPESILDRLATLINERKAAPVEGSYTGYLFAEGIDKILKKVGEEASEVLIASKNGAVNEIKSETADLIYHLSVLLVYHGLDWQDIYHTLETRRSGGRG